MAMVKLCAKVITIVTAQDAYGNICIVKAGGKVITIEPYVDALGLEEVVKLFFRVFEEVCALKEVDEFAVDGLTHGGDCLLVRAFKRNWGASS